MSGELIAGLLEKLGERTGREWTLDDLKKLADIMSKAGSDNVDAVLDELGEMGLNLSEETRMRVKERMKSGNLSMDKLENVTATQAAGKERPKPSKAKGKGRNLPLARKVRRGWGGKRKKR